MYRYIALVSALPHDAPDADLKSLVARITTKGGWTIAFTGRGAVVVHTARRAAASRSMLIEGGRGVVLGALFRRSDSEDQSSGAVSLDKHESDRIVASSGTHLLEHYWGAYLAIIRGEATNTYHVLREPLGNLQCYHARVHNADIFFSHIDDCLDFLPITLPNRQYLSRWLVFSALKSRECAITGIDEVRGGERISLREGKYGQQLLWNPAHIAASDRIDCVEEATRRLRAAVQGAVSAWAARYRSITHTLSGGLDSSIVAACLAKADARPRVSCLNVWIGIGYDREPAHLPGIDKQSAEKIRSILGHGDERRFARLVAERWHFPLVERQRDLSMDLTKLWKVRSSVRPALLFTGMELDEAKIELVCEQGVEAFFSGQGGDTVFLAGRHPFPALDYAYLNGVNLRLWRYLTETAKLSKESFWQVSRKTIVNGVMRRPLRYATSLLHLPTGVPADLIASMTDQDFDPPWASCAVNLPPGKQSHIHGIGGTGYYDYAFESGRMADHVDPLNSQPVWETMLRIPTYVALHGGVSRGLARRAFADVLPDEIRRRQVKGTGTPFYQHLVRRNLPFLRENLLDGQLVREGYLDRKKLLQFFTAEEPFLVLSAIDILAYLSAEIWLSQWQERRAKAAA